MLPRRLLLLALAAVPAAVGFAAYREETLPNGLRVVLIEHHANPMVASTVVVGAGVAVAKGLPHHPSEPQSRRR